MRSERATVGDANIDSNLRCGTLVNSLDRFVNEILQDIINKYPITISR